MDNDTRWNSLSLCPTLTNKKKTDAQRPLQWRHNERDSVSNHQAHDCLRNRLFGQRWKKTSKLCVTGRAGNSPVTGEFPAQMASNAKMFHLMTSSWHLYIQVLIADEGSLEGSIPFDDFLNSETHPPSLLDDFDPKTNTSLILFSSGTTGVPKGVQISSSNIVGLVCSQWWVNTTLY